MENEKHVTILKTDLNAAKYQLDDCNSKLILISMINVPFVLIPCSGMRLL